MSFASPSKFLQKKWDLRQKNLHKRKIKSIKTKLDTTTPKRYPHLIVRLKKIEQDEQRQAAIDQENHILLQKMSSIMSHRSTLDNWNDYETRSLNHLNRLNEQDRIAEENLLIAQRLHKIKPEYDTEKWQEEYDKHEYILDMWSMSTKDFGIQEANTRNDVDRVNNVSRLESERTFSNQNPKLPRIASIKNTLDEDVHQLYRACKQLAKPDEVILKTLVNRSQGQRTLIADRFRQVYEMDLKREMLNTLGKDYQVLLDCLFADLEKEIIELINSSLKEKNVKYLINLFLEGYTYHVLNNAHEKQYEISIQEHMIKCISDKGVRYLLNALFKLVPDIDNNISPQELFEAEPKSRFNKEFSPFICAIKEKSFTDLKDFLTDFKAIASCKSISHFAREDGCSKRLTEAIKFLEEAVHFTIVDYVKRLHSLLQPDNYELVRLLLSKGQYNMNNVCRMYKKHYGVQLIEAIMHYCGPVSPLIAHLVAKQTQELGKDVKGKKKLLPSLSRNDLSRNSAPVNRPRRQVSIHRNLLISSALRDEIRDVRSCVTNLSSDVDNCVRIEQLVAAVIAINNRQLFKRVYKEEFDKDLVEELSELTNDCNGFLLSYFHRNSVEFHVDFIRQVIHQAGVQHPILIFVVVMSNSKVLQSYSNCYMKLYDEKLSEQFCELHVLHSFFSKETASKTFKKMADVDVQRLLDQNDNIKLEVLKTILCKRSLAQICLILTEFDKEHEDGFVYYLENTPGGDRYINIVKCICDPTRFACCLLRDFAQDERQHKLMIYVLLTYFGKKMSSLNQCFKNLYSVNLEAFLSEHINGALLYYVKSLIKFSK